MAPVPQFDGRYLMLGIPGMDRDHMELVRIANRVSVIAASKEFREADLTKELNALHEYTIAHFLSEERYMEQIRYPGFAAHKLEHNRLIATLQALRSAGARGAVTVLKSTLFMQTWLLEHIAKHDAEYAKFATTGHGMAPPPLGGPAHAATSGLGAPVTLHPRSPATA